MESMRISVKFQAHLFHQWLTSFTKDVTNPSFSDKVSKKFQNIFFAATFS